MEGVPHGWAAPASTWLEGSRLAAARVFAPRVSHSCPPPASPGDLPQDMGDPAKLPSRYGFRPWVLEHKRFRVCPLRVVFPPSPVELPKLSLAGLKSQMLGGVSPPCRTPSRGAWCAAQRLTPAGGILCDVLLLQSVVNPWGCGVDCIASPPLPPVSLGFLLYVFSCRSFW